MCDSGTIKTINRSLLGQPGSPVMKVARDPPKHDQPNYDNIHRVFQGNWTKYVTFFKILFCWISDFYIVVYIAFEGNVPILHF